MARPVRMLHTADLHLDAPFAGIDAADSRVRDALVDATYAALDRIVALAEERNVDAVIIAGDVYNSADRSLRAQLAFAKATEALDRAGILTFVAHGNHDHVGGWSAGLPLPETVTVFAADRVTRYVVERDGEPLYSIYGRSFGTASERSNLARGFAREAEDVLAIGVLHTNVGSRPEHDDYAPSSTDDLRAAGMDYWALGHIHKPGRVLDSPRAVYAGCPQGLTPREDGPRGCYVVDIADGVVTEEFVETCSVVWDARTLDLTSADDVDDVRAAIRSTCDAVRADAGGRPVVVRLALEGRCAAHADLTRSGVHGELVADARAEQMSDEPWVWIDRAYDRTRPPIDVERLRSAEDFLGDLVRIADGLLDDPASADELVQDVLAPLATQAGSLLDLELDAADIVSRARDLALDRLGGEEGS